MSFHFSVCLYVSFCLPLILSLCNCFYLSLFISLSESVSPSFFFLASLSLLLIHICLSLRLRFSLLRSLYICLFIFILFLSSQFLSLSVSLFTCLCLSLYTCLSLIMSFLHQNFSVTYCIILLLMFIISFVNTLIKGHSLINHLFPLNISLFKSVSAHIFFSISVYLFSHFVSLHIHSFLSFY